MTETSSKTIPEGDLPWRSRAGADREPIPHLVIVWSLDEPDRIGEAIPIPGPCIVGTCGYVGGNRGGRNADQRHQ